MLSPPVGIVIPTHNRSRALLECLEHLERQTFKDFEVIVVDDGSSDDTPSQIEKYRERSPLRISYLRQPNSGPAKARNRGVSVLKSSVCLFLGDDIFASPKLVEHHYQLHQTHPDLKIAGLGLTRWAPSGQEVTPFMNWLDEANIQFAYPQLLNGAKPDWCHFYTSNLSVKSEVLRKFPFSEQFPYAAMEDSELGYRIKKFLGLDLRFIPDALAYHLHPTTFRQACTRMTRVGYSCGLFEELWPEQRRPKDLGRWRRLAIFVAKKQSLLRPLTELADIAMRIGNPNNLTRFVLECYREAGFESRRRG